MDLKPALAVNLKDYDLSLLEGKTWRISEKVDGVRRMFYKNSSGRVYAYSRTSKTDKWLTHITEYLEQAQFPKDAVYDCEIVDRELYFAKVDSFIIRSESAGKANQQYPDNKRDLMAICFDIYRMGDTTKGSERNKELIKLFSNIPLTAPIIKVPIFGVMEGMDSTLINSIMKQIQAQKGEGVMLMDMDAMYVPGRSKTLVKVKRMEEFEGVIVDIEMAKDGTKIEGGIASLICEVVGCTIPVRVGGGFSHELRQELAKREILGQRVEIDAFGYTRNKAGTISLSMPVFKAFVE